MAVAVGQGKDIAVLRQVSSLHFLGILYGVFTLYLGFYFGVDEYKVMGLAPYGNQRKYYGQISDLIHLREDGTYTIPLFASNRTQQENETHSGVLHELEARLNEFKGVLHKRVFKQEWGRKDYSSVLRSPI